MKKYSQHKNIQPCKLDKEDLIELVEIIKKGFPNSSRKEDFEVFSNLPNMNISEHSIEDFLTHKDIPESIDRLSIRMIG